MKTRQLNKPDYTYRAELIRVIDGDTIDVMLDMGCYTYSRKRLRFLLVDTEEMRDSDIERRIKAREAKAYVENLLNTADEILIQTVMDSTGKYGRLLAYVWYIKDEKLYNLNLKLIEEGFEKE